VSAVTPNILKQRQLIGGDGTYTFSFEADDGSHRSKVRDKDGLVTGTYGYSDENEEKKEVKYSSVNPRALTLDESPSEVQISMNKFFIR